MYSEDVYSIDSDGNEVLVFSKSNSSQLRENIRNEYKLYSNGIQINIYIKFILYKL